jgi:hypothetical protein
MLGVTSTTSSIPFSLDDNISWLSTEDLYNKHLCQIAGLILTRNQADSTHAFSSTQEIDEKLGSLAKQMPQTWWEIPTSLIDGRTEEAGSELDRILCHFWHFQLETLVHLPFMLRAATDRRYDYSRISCLNASRSLIKRWMFIRKSPSTLPVNTLVEFQAFTAAITILLGLLGPKPLTTDQVFLKERHGDSQLVETTVQILEDLKQHGVGAQVVNQGISVIRTLQGVLLNEGNISDDLRLEIQYFGTISISRSGTVHSLEGERILGAHPRSTETTIRANPLYQAGQSSLAPLTADAEITSTLMSVPINQEYQNVNGEGEIFNDSNSWMNDNFLHFTSSQFPMFEAQAFNGATVWPEFQESNALSSNSSLNPGVEIGWDF